MTLVDTSVWIDHLRRPDKALAMLLDVEQVLVHPFVLGELSLGSYRGREDVLKGLGFLETAPLAPESLVGDLARKHQLWGRGIGWVDCHLLATALEANAHVMTHDKALRAAWILVRT